MTLCKLLFDHFVNAGCNGNKTLVAELLHISRHRVNAISGALNNGAGMASTLTELLCQYRRNSMDINGVVDMYLIMRDAEENRKCTGLIQLKGVMKEWVKEEKALVSFCERTYESLSWVAGYIGGICCRDGLCPEEYGQNCPCWWLVGLMESIQRLDIDIPQDGNR